MPSVGLLPAIAIVVGALAGVLIPVGGRLLLAILVPLTVAAAIGWRRGAPAATVILLAAGFGVAGAALAADARDRALHPVLRHRLDREYGGFAIGARNPEGPHGPLATRIILSQDAASTGEVVLLRGRAQAVRVNGTWRPVPGEEIRVTVSGDASRARVDRWRAGRTLVAPVTFRRPARYLNDGVPDAERDLALAGTALLGSIKSALLVDVERRGGPVAEAAGRARAHVRRAMDRFVASHDPLASGIVAAVLIGDRTGVSEEVRERLQAAGTYHVIAISGGNIAILVGLVLLVLMLAGIRGRPAALVSLIALGIYAEVVTAGPSVWRATLMAALYLAARLIDHRTPVWHAIAMAAAVMVVLRPLDVRGPGFILSFGATAALVGVAQRAGEVLAPALARLPRRARWARWVAASMVASLAVEAVLMPVSAQAFSRVTVAGLVLNLLAVPLMTVVQMAGIAVSVAAPVDVLARPAGWVAVASARALVESGRLVEVLPFLAHRVPPPGLVTIVIYYAGLAMLLVPRRLPRVAGGAMLFAAATVMAIGPVRARESLAAWESAPLRLTVFDVGQGEALLLQVPGAGGLLVDSGGAPFGGGGADIGRRVLAPAIWARGARRLDALLVTHPDPDHVGGARALVEDFAPARLWLGIPVPGHESLQALVDTAARGGAAVEAVRSGEVRAWGRARIRVLHPPEPDWERRRVRNDDSVVLEVLYGDVALLLTGDIGADIERAIVPQLTPARVRVLKVAHHGSRTSTSNALIDAWRPQIAVISCGRGNRFGHPTQEVLDRLAAAGTRVLRTDRDGQVTIETDGRRVEVGTFGVRR
jgi:competence protein ComEC